MNKEMPISNDPQPNDDDNEKNTQHLVKAEKMLSAAEGFSFIAEAFIEDGKLNVEFKDSYSVNFEPEIFEKLDESLKEIPGIEDVDWADREFFIITTDNKTDTKDIIKAIDSKLVDLSKKS